MNDPSDDMIVVSDQEGSAHIDLYALTHKDIQDPPTSLVQALSQIGPGLILAASIVGTGELINTTALGAKQGFVLLWLILISCVIKVFVQVEMGRYAITQGKTSLAALHTLPGPRFGTSWLGWLWLIMMLATNGQLAAMEGLVGEAAVMVFHGDDGVRSGVGLTASVPFWAALTCFAAIALLLSGGYKRLEKITTILVALVTFVTVLGALRLPMSLGDVAGGLKFGLPDSKDGLILAFSAFGITGVGASELFAYPYWCIEKGYARATGPRTQDDDWARRAKGWLRVMQLDAWFSMVVFTLATVAFYFMGAAALHGKGLGDADLKGAGMIRTLANMYVQVLGPWARPFFLLGAWAVLFKTLYVATAGNSRLTADFLNLSGFWPQKTPVDRERIVKVFCVVYPLLSLGIFLAYSNPLKLITIGGAAQALMLPLIAGATLYLRYRDTDPRVAPSKVADLLSWTAFLGMTAVSVYYLGELALKLTR
ncbi:MAG: mntH 1 [Planctomycetota bacterium]|nr:mntH 1 [Planctomycetota bacterium]